MLCVGGGGDHGRCSFCLNCEAWSCRLSCMGIMSVSYFVMRMLCGCVLSTSCGSPQCCVLHYLQFVNVISVWVSRLRIAEFPDSVRLSAP